MVPTSIAPTAFSEVLVARARMIFACFSWPWDATSLSRPKEGGRVCMQWYVTKYSNEKERWNQLFSLENNVHIRRLLRINIFF